MITLSLPLLKKARVNSVLLAGFFLINTIGSAASGSYILAIIGIAATYYTISDVIDLHASIKEIEKEVENGTKAQ